MSLSPPSSPPLSSDLKVSSVPIGQVPHGGVLYDESGDLSFVLWYSSPFEPRDRVVYDLRKAVMFTSVWGGVVILLSCLLSLLSSMLVYATIELLLVLLLPISGYLGASKERRWVMLLYACCSLVCVLVNVWWWIACAIAVSKAAQLSEDDFSMHYPGYTKGASLWFGIASLVMTFAVLAFWSYSGKSLI
eukprot:GHVN01026673.1.p1 GENE.GHVN01026673.1~~GHVN01026673.1.p1  ORF type:complete len:190 (+),score=28.40 GHVN01026673.1:561-1130(+)